MLPNKVPLCDVLIDGGGSTHIIVPRAMVNRNLLMPQVDVWWNRSAKYMVGGRTYMDEAVVLRQQPDEKERADVIMLTLAQCYAMLQAISIAIESR